MKKTIGELFRAPYWIIDILPAQVPEESAGQYFAVEKYYLDKERMARIKQKHIDVVLKLNCYRDITLDEDEIVNPSPQQIAQEMRSETVCIMTDEAMILSDPDDTHMPLFNPDENLLELVRGIAAAEGLFVWKPEQTDIMPTQ